MSPLFDSAALPAVFERLLLLATTTAATTTATTTTRMSNSSRGGSSFASGGGDQNQQHQQQERQQGIVGEEGGGQVRDDGCGDDALLREAKAGLDGLLRWALPSLVSLVLVWPVYGGEFTVCCCC